MCGGVLQYEDPTDDLQTIRERIELRQAVKLRWLMELAAKVAQAAASALPANGHAQVAHLGLVSFPSGCTGNVLHTLYCL